MKKIINGKKYDTETAEELAYWENMPNALDFNQYSETLYRKKRANISSMVRADR